MTPLGRVVLVGIFIFSATFIFMGIFELAKHLSLKGFEAEGVACVEKSIEKADDAAVVCGVDGTTYIVDTPSKDEVFFTFRDNKGNFLKKTLASSYPNISDSAYYYKTMHGVRFYEKKLCAEEEAKMIKFYRNAVWMDCLRILIGLALLVFAGRLARLAKH